MEKLVLSLKSTTASLTLPTTSVPNAIQIAWEYQMMEVLANQSSKIVKNILILASAQSVTLLTSIYQLTDFPVKILSKTAKLTIQMEHAALVIHQIWEFQTVSNLASQPSTNVCSTKITDHAFNVILLTLSLIMGRNVLSNLLIVSLTLMIWNALHARKITEFQMIRCLVKKSF